MVPSGSLQCQEGGTNPKDVQSGSLIEMMPSAGVPEQSPTTRLIRARLPAARVLPTLVSSSSSSEKLDYSRDDINRDNMRLVPDTGKFSHMTVEEMQVVAPEKEFPLGETTPLRILFLLRSFLSCQPCRHCFNISLDDILLRLSLLLKVILLKYCQND